MMGDGGGSVDAESERWQARRLELMEQLTREVRTKYPLLSWKIHAELVTAAVERQLLQERVHAHD